MNEFYQSPVLYALGWAIAGSFWQMGLLWMVHQLLFVVPFRQRPGIKHGSAVILLGLGTTWFLSTFFLRLAKMREMQSYIYRIEEDSRNISTSTGFSVTGLVTEAEKFLPYFSAAYLVVLVLLFFRLAQGLFITQQIGSSRRLHPAIQWQQFVDRLCVQLNIDREVMVYLSDTINVPATIGFIKPVILLPVATLNNLTVSQAEAIILHEIAHIRRYDYLINIFVSIVETLLFFNPFARLLSVSIRKERELCCDDFVIQYQRDPQCYAHALLSLEKSRNAARLAMAATGKESLLLGRVKRILQVPDQPVQYRYHLMALFLVATMIMCIAILNPPKTTLHHTSASTTLWKEKNGDNLYYSVPTIFNNIRKELPKSVLSDVQDKKTRERKQAKTERIVKEKLDKNPGMVFGLRTDEFHDNEELETPMPPEEVYAFAFPDMITPHIAPLATWDKNFSFDLEHTTPEPPRETKARKTSPDARPKIRMKRDEKSVEFFKINDESLFQYFNKEDINNLMASEEKRRIAVAGKAAVESLVPMVRGFQNEVLLKRNEKNVQKLKALHDEAYSNVRVKASSKPVIRTFASEDGTLISIVQDNGKIEITLKDNR